MDDSAWREDSTWRAVLSTERHAPGWEEEARPQLPGDGELERAFQQDLDHLTFSPLFRRLQNKTQVFANPSCDFVRTRLSHSLETARVGSRLGRAVATKLGLSASIREAIATVIQTACLMHDIGNPPFGHYGEDSISEWFQQFIADASDRAEGLLTRGEQEDLEHCEGNALGMHFVLHRGFRGNGGLRLTHAVLAAAMKYPWTVTSRPSANKYKYCIMSGDVPMVKKVAENTGMRQQGPEIWSRHPLAFLVEAADDIAYSCNDIEDAFKLKYISFQQAVGCWKGLLDEDWFNFDSNPEAEGGGRPTHPQYLRRKIESARSESSRAVQEAEYINSARDLAIELLVEHAATQFVENVGSIFRGEFTGPEGLPRSIFTGIGAESVEKCKRVAWDNVYRLPSSDLKEGRQSIFEILDYACYLLTEFWESRDSTGEKWTGLLDREVQELCEEIGVPFESLQALIPEGTPTGEKRMTPHFLDSPGSQDSPDASSQSGARSLGPYYRLMMVAVEFVVGCTDSYASKMAKQFSRKGQHLRQRIAARAHSKRQSSNSPLPTFEPSPSAPTPP